MKCKSLALIALLLLCIAAGVSLHYNLDRDVLSSGGTIASSISYGLEATLGQPGIGLALSSTYATCYGFWCVPRALAVTVGKAVVKYLFTFGQLGIVSALLVLLTLMLGRQVFDVTVRLWAQPRSR